MALHEIQVPPEPPAAKPRPHLEAATPPLSSPGRGIRTTGPWRPGPASAWRAVDEGAHAPLEQSP
jgi:hypothetical protein